MSETFAVSLSSKLNMKKKKKQQQNKALNGHQEQQMILTGTVTEAICLCTASVKVGARLGVAAGWTDIEVFAGIY